MLTIDDCMHFSNLTEEEIIAIAEHEHLPDAVACELGRYLAESPRGVREILKILAEDIAHAEGQHDGSRSVHLHRVLDHFAATHHYI